MNGVNLVKVELYVLDAHVRLEFGNMDLYWNQSTQCYSLMGYRNAELDFGSPFALYGAGVHELEGRHWRTPMDTDGSEIADFVGNEAFADE